MPVKANAPSLASARTALVINQFATPGLGSLMAGRYLAGTFQLLFALAGFVLILVWFFTVLKTAYTLMENTGQPEPRHILGWMGLGNFLFAWCWAWFTSISVLREAQRAHRARVTPMPPIPPASTPPDPRPPREAN